MYLWPGKSKSFSFSFVAKTEDVGKKIEVRNCVCLYEGKEFLVTMDIFSICQQVTGIEVMLGSDSGRCVFLTWRGAGGDVASAHEALQASRSFQGWDRCNEGLKEVDWDCLTMQPSTM